MSAGILALALSVGSCSSTGSAKRPGEVARVAITVPDGWSGKATVSTGDVGAPLVEDGKAWLDRGLVLGRPFTVQVEGDVPAEGLVMTRSYQAPLEPGMGATLAVFNEIAGAW